MAVNAEAEPPPLIQIVRGRPTNEELAALITVLLPGSGRRPASPGPAAVRCRIRHRAPYHSPLSWQTAV
ncbi:acyl-CoA carboxylase subunit epsilon [Streptomyces mirabilis]|uniref:acyl-CoA carboxylase subunit epsilon n=1 Tax=Streptomyces mirabilis TaxID=68239 RepID=UPI0036CD0770